jgi:hypothetical protein
MLSARPGAADAIRSFEAARVHKPRNLQPSYARNALLVSTFLPFMRLNRCSVPRGAYSMSKEVAYRNFAAKMLDLALRASTPADKERLLAMAEAWFGLADRVHRAGRRQACKVRDLHPLIRARLTFETREFE